MKTTVFIRETRQWISVRRLSEPLRKPMLFICFYTPPEMHFPAFRARRPFGLCFKARNVTFRVKFTEIAAETQKGPPKVPRNSWF